MLDLMLPASKIVAITEFGYYVQGKKATKNEAMVAMALEHEEVEFLFQYWYQGGREILGGYVLDFLVFAPTGIPVEVFGEYWHQGSMASGDRYKVAVLTQAFGREPVIIWGNESDTYELALQAVRKKVI